MANIEEKEENKQEIKNIILTGATGVIGYEIAKGLISQPNITLHILGRDEEKTEKIVHSLSNDKHKKKSSSIKHYIVDLSSNNSINKFIDQYKKEYKILHVLINNAAIVPEKKLLDEDGNELQFSVNVLSYYRLMNGLIDCLEQGSNKNNISRIVNVASQYAEDPKINDLQFKKTKYDANTAYKRAKGANRLLTWYAAKLYKNKNIGVYSCHPGVTNSEVLKGLGFGGFESPEQCAMTPIKLALDSQITLKDSGKFWVNQQPSNCPFQKKEELQRQLWEECAKFTKT